MKKILCQLLLFSALLCGAESVIPERVMFAHTEKGMKASALITPEGGLTFKGSVNYSGKFGYLISRVKVKPFKLTGKSLALTIRSQYHPQDSFYIKAFDASGKIVASFVTGQNLSDLNAMICTPGSTAAGVKYIASDVKADPDAEIVQITFYFCRKGPAPDFDAEVSKIELLPRSKSSSVSPAPQNLPGKIKLYKINGCRVPGATAKADMTADGKLSFSGDVRYNKYDYLIANVAVRPFILAGHSLSLKVKFKNFVPGDSFYVKAQDANGKTVASFYTRRDLTNPATLICTPGRSSGGMTHIPSQTQVPENSPVVRLLFYCGRKGPSRPVSVDISDITLLKRPESGFAKHGIGIVSAEVRNFIAFTDKNGRRMILCNPHDEGQVYLLLTDVKTGKTWQYYAPYRGSVFGGVLTDKGKFVYGVGGKILIFDIYTRKFTVGGKCAHSNLCATVAPDGKVYMGGAKYSFAVMVDPETGKSKELGRMDDQEHYCSYLAVDKNGFLYAGIGTSRANVVSLDPRTGKRTQLLPESMRKLGTANVVPGDDGFVYIVHDGFFARCLDGKIVQTGARCPKVRPIKNVKYQHSLEQFGDGSFIEKYDMGKREIVIREKDGSRKVIKFDYVSGGLNLTSMAKGPDGNVYFSSSHPHHLGRLETSGNKLRDFGFNPRVGGGNFCNMTDFNGKLYACEYAGGRLWVYDPKRPVSYVDGKPENFGIPFEELLKTAASRNAGWRALKRNRILFASAGSDDNDLSLLLKVPADGKYFLNLQFMNSMSYGTVTVSAGNTVNKFNTQSSSYHPGKIFNLGPFDLKRGTFKVAFNLKANRNRDAKHYFGIIGIELSGTPRKTKIDHSAQTGNPEILGTWSNLVTRPRTIAVNPVTHEVVIAGFANYGMVGGGFGIWDSKTGKTGEINQFLNGESCIDMIFLPDGNLLGATSIEAPGGGHEVAKAASVFLMDWKQRKVIKRIQLPGVRHIYGVRLFGNKIYAAANNGVLYRINPGDFTLDAKIPMEGHALIRNPLLLSEDNGRLFLLQGRTISEIDRTKGTLKPIARTPWHLSAGGAVIGDRIYFIQRENICSWKIGDSDI